MKLGIVALKIRATSTRFGNNVVGAAELAIAIGATLAADTAFVIPLREDVSPNKLDSGLNQLITEKFGVVVALANDSDIKDKTGFISYDLINTVRTELFTALLAWQIDTTTEDVVSYSGGRILDITPAYLWYQYEFESTTRITEDDGIDVGRSSLNDFNEIYQQYILAPDSLLPLTGESLPTNLAPSKLNTLFTNPHEFSDAFSLDFKTLKGILN